MGTIGVTEGLVSNQAEAATASKTVEVKSFNPQFADTKKEGKVTLPYSKVDVFYYDKDNQKHKLASTMSDRKGVVRAGSYHVPKYVKRLYFDFKLEDNDDNMLLNNDNRVIHFYTSALINSKNKIDASPTTTFKDNIMYGYIKLYATYFDFVDDQRQAVKKAQTELKKQGVKVDGFKYQPIKMKYIPTANNDRHAALMTRSKAQGPIKPYEKYLEFRLPMYNEVGNAKQWHDLMRVYIGHEYSHFTMWNSTGGKGMGGSYTSHSGYNENVNTSYKEGWGLFQANRFPWGFDMNGNLDVSVQSSKQDNRLGDRNRLYGKSTNRTVSEVFKDIYDLQNRVEGEADSYNIAQDVFGKKHSRTELEQLSNGMIYIMMRDSKAINLEQYIHYVKKHYVKDTKSFERMLKTNGLTKDGQFTLDGNGHRIH